MKRILSKKQHKELYHFKDGEKINGIHKNLHGDCTGLSGDCSGLIGDCSGLSGDLDNAMLSKEERRKGVKICYLIEEVKGKLCTSDYGKHLNQA